MESFILEMFRKLPAMKCLNRTVQQHSTNLREEDVAQYKNSGSRTHRETRVSFCIPWKGMSEQQLCATSADNWSTVGRT